MQEKEEKFLMTIDECKKYLDILFQRLEQEQEK